VCARARVCVSFSLFSFHFAHLFWGGVVFFSFFQFSQDKFSVFGIADVQPDYGQVRVCAPLPLVSLVSLSCPRFIFLHFSLVVVSYFHVLQCKLSFFFQFDDTEDLWDGGDDVSLIFSSLSFFLLSFSLSLTLSRSLFLVLFGLQLSSVFLCVFFSLSQGDTTGTEEEKNNASDPDEFVFI